ncbi:carbohydrate ABC transporter permease [Paenibacillus sp. YYML68]|uniref:carbohydrate ABC transporter permease n=1 Tax=Paenibacillus sp. YYML68 TaxID=2909250 RepID=UPI002491276D|nr:sugar ABC transporter permease [Paenibacillus sp. YYML68]
MSMSETTLSWRAKAAKVKASVLPRSKRRRKEALIGLAYALPALLLLVLFRYWPLVFGMWMSLWKWGYVPERFIGLDNYTRIFTEELIVQDPVAGLQLGAVGQSLLVTFYYALGTIPAALVLSFFIAYVLFQNFKGRGMVRTIFFLPFITSQVAAAIVFKWIFHPNVGIANAALESAGLARMNWLYDPDPVLMKLLHAFGGAWPEWLPQALAGPTLALLVIMLFSVWCTVGFNVVIFMAGLSSIPKELYEAARIDGARTPSLIRHVTVPLMMPMLFMLLIVSVIGAFESFNAFYVFSGGEGGPLGSTMSFPLYIFRSFYVYGQVGYAAAASMVLFGILLVLTWVQYKFGEKRVHYQA